MDWNWTPLALLLQVLGIFVGATFTVMMGAGLGTSLLYGTRQHDEPVEDLRIVIPTVAAEHVRPALENTIAHTLSRFPEYEVYCLVDEGSDLQAELVARTDLETVVVPDDYECSAIAKGRAIQYFIETVVSDAPTYWYAFIDDDNRIMDDSFTYEIPYYEARGYRAMNPVLVPRLGRSTLTFMSDHIRLVDDLALYRLFTGVIGKPYLGFHGELLCARGDVLVDVGFDRRTIVEDFGFALELAKDHVPVWQSATRVSVLSPHDVRSFLEQRSRWYLGIARYLPHAPTISRLVVGLRITTWSVAITSSWLLTPLWLLGYGFFIPRWFLLILATGTCIYVGTIAVGALRLGGRRGLVFILFTPVYATLEHVVPLYALWSGEREFVVIEK